MGRKQSGTHDPHKERGGPGVRNREQGSRRGGGGGAAAPAKAGSGAESGRPCCRCPVGLRLGSAAGAPPPRGGGGGERRRQRGCGEGGGEGAVPALRFPCTSSHTPRNGGGHGRSCPPGLPPALPPPLRRRAAIPARGGGGGLVPKGKILIFFF